MVLVQEPYVYDECGLEGVVLHGIDVHACPSCGEKSVRIPRIQEMHETLARAVARQSRRLRPDEIRFLRKHLGWSGKTFAARLKVTPETVSRWESGVQRMRFTAEALLRLYVIQGVQEGPYDDAPAGAPEVEERRPTLTLYKVDDHWESRDERQVTYV
jgi:putative zinc finger/helix-turn-helix YgiT family protein